MANSTECFFFLVFKQTYKTRTPNFITNTGWQNKHFVARNACKLPQGGRSTPDELHKKMWQENSVAMLI